MAALGWAADRIGRKAFLVSVICASGCRISGLAFAGGFSPRPRLFFGATEAGRLSVGWVVARPGNRGTLLGAGLLAAFGMAVALASTLPALVVGGFSLVGIATSGVASVVFSAARDLALDRAGAAISVVTTSGYGGFCRWGRSSSGAWPSSSASGRRSGSWPSWDSRSSPSPRPREGRIRRATPQLSESLGPCA